MSDADNRAEKTQKEGELKDAQEGGLIQEMIGCWDPASTSLTSEQQELGRSLIKHYGERLIGTKIDRAFFEGALAELDAMISLQLDEILHNPDFQKIESAWTGLKWMVERIDFNQNIRVEILSVSKQDLLQDFVEAVGDITTTGLYQKIYTSQFGAPNGKPYGAMILNYEFTHFAPDMTLLSKVAQVANMAHAPVISAISPELFGPKGFEHLTDVRYSVKDALSGEKYVKWNGFREDENASYVGLVLPHFLLRVPYNRKDNPTNDKEFQYEEKISGKSSNYLWGNAAFAFASRLAESFKKYHWCWRIVGEESGGAITDMKVHVFDDHGETVQKPPTDVALAFRKEEELTEAGFIPLLWLREKDQSVFYRAPSAKLPLKYPDTPEGSKKESDDKLRTKLPMVFILTRFAHYIKRLQTRYIGMPIGRADIEKELNEWIRQYVNQVKNPQKGTLGSKPLFQAEVNVTEDSKNPGVFLCDFKIVPHTMAEGFTTTLSLITRTETGNK